MPKSYFLVEQNKPDLEFAIELQKLTIESAPPQIEPKGNILGFFSKRDFRFYIS